MLPKLRATGIRSPEQVLRVLGFGALKDTGLEAQGLELSPGFRVAGVRL